MWLEGRNCNMVKLLFYVQYKTESWRGIYFVLLVIITIMYNNKPQVETFAQVEQVIRFSFRPSIIMKIHLILLLWVHRHLHSLETEIIFFSNMQLHEFQFQNKNTALSLLSSINAIFYFLLLCSVWPSLSYLVEASKWVVLSFLCCTSPVMEDGAIFSGCIGKGHPLPGPHLLTAKFCFHCPVALRSITR